MSREEALRNLSSSLAPMAGPYGEISINGVDVQGRCAPKLLQAHIQPLFQAQHVNDLVQAFSTVQNSLFSLGIFKDVVVSISPEKIVTISLVANNKFVARVGTNVGQSEGSGYIRGTMCNASGWGEILTVDTSAGTRTKSSHLISGTVPLPFNNAVGWKAEALAYSADKIFEWAGCQASMKGFTTRFSHTTGSSFGLDAVLRTVMASRLHASSFVRHDAGDNFKLSAFYDWRYDTRLPADPFSPKGHGFMIDVHNEVAVAYSTSPFLKSVLKWQSAFQVYKKVTGSLNAKCGMVIPLKPATTTHILDRLNLGGPLDVRGFRLNHLGPHEGADAMGGDVMGAVGLSLFAPIPRVASPNVRLHGFWNAGFLGDRTQNLKDLITPSASTGLGVVYVHPSARFELNLTIPLISRTSELVHKGLQFGVGLEFL